MNESASGASRDERVGELAVMSESALTESVLGDSVSGARPQ